MKKQYLLMLILFISSLFIFGKCKPDPDPIVPTKVCNPAQCQNWAGKECVNGECQCQAGKTQWYGECIGGDSNYISTAKSRIWGDKVIMHVAKSLSTEYSMFLGFSFVDLTRDGTPGTRGRVELYRFKDTDRDSIHELYVGVDLYVLPDGTYVFPQYKGRILDDKTIRLRVVLCTHTDNGRINKRIDSTEYIFKRIQ